jgi:relaxase/mobilization nuclease domain protein
LDESFKVITIDKTAVEYYRKLSNISAQIHKIGVLYNQANKSINSYHSVKTAQHLLQMQERYSLQIISLQQQAIALTIDYRKRCLPRFPVQPTSVEHSDYNFQKVVSREASILLTGGLYSTLERGYTMDEVLSDMQALTPKKCRTKKVVFHSPLNPHPGEKLSDEQLSQIAKEYMQALSYGNQPYIVFKHNDIAREHIHIVSLRVDSLDKFENRRSKRISDTLERKYGLIPSPPNKGQKAQPMSIL